MRISPSASAAASQASPADVPAPESPAAAATSHPGSVRHDDRNSGSDSAELQARTCSSCGHPLGSQSRDWLTGLADRGTWHQQASHALDEAMAQRKPVGLLIADLDWFKWINDTHGHLAGDEALRIVAAILRTAARDGDLLARYGGDEFLALLPATDVADALTVARRFSLGVNAASVSTVSAQDGRETTLSGLTVSIGLAVCLPTRKANVTVDGLLLAADGALLAAKRNGRGQSCLALPPGTQSGGQQRWTFDRVVPPSPAGQQGPQHDGHGRPNSMDHSGMPFDHEQAAVPRPRAGTGPEKSS